MEIGIYGIKDNKLFRIEDGDYDNYDLIVAKDFLPEILPDKFVLILWRYDPVLIEELNKRLNVLKKKSVIITNNLNHSIEFLKEVLENIKGVWVEDEFGEKIIYGNGEHMLVWEFYSIEHFLNVLEKEVKFRYYLLKRKEIPDYEFTTIFSRYFALRKIIENIEKVKKNFEVYFVPLNPILGFPENVNWDELSRLTGIDKRILSNIRAEIEIKYNNIYILLREARILLKTKIKEELIKKRNILKERAPDHVIISLWEEFTSI